MQYCASQHLQFHQFQKIKINVLWSQQYFFSLNSRHLVNFNIIIYNHIIIYIYGVCRMYIDLTISYDVFPIKASVSKVNAFDHSAAIMFFYHAGQLGSYQYFFSLNSKHLVNFNIIIYNHIIIYIYGVCRIYIDLTISYDVFPMQLLNAIEMS